MEPFKFLGLTGWAAYFILALCIVVGICVCFGIGILIGVVETRMKRSKQEVNSEQVPEKEEYRRFCYIGRLTVGIWYGLYTDMIIDRETRVQYFARTMTPMVDEDGKPILYEGDFSDIRAGYSNAHVERE